MAFLITLLRFFTGARASDTHSDYPAPTFLMSSGIKSSKSFVLKPAALVIMKVGYHQCEECRKNQYRFF